MARAGLFTEIEITQFISNNKAFKKQHWEWTAEVKDGKLSRIYKDCVYLLSEIIQLQEEYYASLEIRFA